MFIFAPLNCPQIYANRDSQDNQRQRALGVALAICSTAALGEARLHGLFTDNMVLQRNTAVPIWGWADEGEEVTVSFGTQTATTKARHGKWLVHIEPRESEAPAELRVEAKNSIRLRNVAVGEVWVASGQSNMEWPMRLAYDPEAEMARASNAQLRFFKVRQRSSDDIADDVAGRWAESTPQSVAHVSAVAYYFARDLQLPVLQLPVGIIQASVGSLPAEAWVSEPVLRADPRYGAIFENHARQRAAWNQRAADRRAQAPWRPAELYNGMVAPLMPFATQGVIWYQGESNAGRAHQYRDLIVDLIRNWRQAWGRGDFPFLQVQLAPFRPISHEPRESAWAELREAQLLATRRLPKVGLAVITDVGSEDNIHPPKKAPVGVRLALLARHFAYGEKLVWSGPQYRSFVVQDGKAILSFYHIGSGLTTHGEKLKGFAIAAEDRRFLLAKAVIWNNEVVLSNPLVAKPVAVRFGWADFPDVDLWNREGLPATPFRTDDIPAFTGPKEPPVN